MKPPLFFTTAMLNFDPQNPFPLDDSHTYAEAQEHSRRVDEWLGLRIEPIEDHLRRSPTKESQHQLWIGLPIQSLLTPYSELRIILEKLHLKPGQSIVDLGAAYGRLG